MLHTAIEFRTKCLEADKFIKQIDESLQADTTEQSTITIEIVSMKRNKSQRKKSNKKQLKYECIKCEKVFNSRYYLQKHEYAVHTEINPEEYYECDNCIYRAKTKSLMRSHQINNHSFSTSKPTVTFQCKFCGRICLSTGALYSHERTHRNLAIEEYLKCPHCEKAFKEKRLLKNHIQLVHEKSRM
jgi:DNA-directed RNA polymerase subunit RPC12/RpoP